MSWKKIKEKAKRINVKVGIASPFFETTHKNVLKQKWHEDENKQRWSEDYKGKRGVKIKGL